MKIRSFADIASRRLANQQLARQRFTSPHDVVHHFGAIQAQDYLGALWAVGCRMKNAVEPDIEQALARREIVRSWPLRGTLHFVAAEDLRWMLELCAPRGAKRESARLERQLGITETLLEQCASILQRELEGGRSITRPALYALLHRNGVETNGRGLHLIWLLAQRGHVCFGPREGKQHAFVLLDEWLPESEHQMERDDALAKLASRYFGAHGPATTGDFSWWSGLTLTEARKGIELAELESDLLDDVTYWSVKRRQADRTTPAVHLLPPFDEYTVAYRDRQAVLDPAFAKKVNAGGGMLNPIVVVDGRVVATWKRALRANTVDISVNPFGRLDKATRLRIQESAERYRHYVGAASMTIKF